MAALAKKFRLIILPYLLVFIICCGLYTLLHWLLVINLELVSLKAETLELFIPAGLALVLGFFYLRPCIRRLKIKNDGRSDIPTLYTLVAVAGIAIPACIAQSYMTKATGRMQPLENIDEISKTKKAKYYTLKDHYVYKYAYNVAVEFTTRGKHNEDLVIDIFYVSPILAKEDDSVARTCRAWQGIKFSSTIDNRDDDDVIDKNYRAFYHECWNKFLAMDLDSFTYLERSPNSDDHDAYLRAIKEQTVFSSPDHTVLTPVYEPFAARIGEKPKWLWLSAVIGFVVFTIMVLIPGLKPDSRFAAEKRKARMENKSTFRAILPHKGSIVTPLVAYAIALIYLGMVFSGMGLVSFRSVDLIAIGGNYGPKTLHGEWWRLITNVFLHGGLMHILNNLFGLVMAGVFLESWLGSGRFAFVYIISGICASLTSVWWDPSKVSIGASGAIFGLNGVMLALMLFRGFNPLFKRGFLWLILIYVGYNLIIGAAMPGVDNSAHVGGLISGFVLAMLFLPGMRKKRAEIAAELEELIRAAEEPAPAADVTPPDDTTYTDQR